MEFSDKLVDRFQDLLKVKNPAFLMKMFRGISEAATRGVL